MKRSIKLLSDHGWALVTGTGQPCAKCLKPVNGESVLHPRSARHLHVKCALAVSGLRNVK
jgi:hypothetical protein